MTMLFLRDQIKQDFSQNYFVKIFFFNFCKNDEKLKNERIFLQSKLSANNLFSTNIQSLLCDLESNKSLWSWMWVNGIVYNANFNESFIFSVLLANTSFTKIFLENPLFILYFFLCSFYILFPNSASVSSMISPNAKGEAVTQTHVRTQ